MSHWRGIVALDSPEHKKARINNSTCIYTPMKIKSPVDDMKTSFDNYEAFKRDLEPNASKIDFRRFLTKMTKTKNIYDGNIQAGLDYNKRIVEYKGKE